jgi:hypothetical protein
MATEAEPAHDVDMNDESPTAPTLPLPAVTRVEEERSSIVVALIAAALGIVAGLTIGVGIGWLAIESAASDCSPSDGWCELGAALVGLLFGVASGAVAYVTAGIVTIARSRPTGRRGRLIGAHIAIPPVLFVLAALLSALTDALI